MKKILSVLLSLVAFGALAFTQNATNNQIGTTSGALKANGSGVVSQAACADLSNGAASCSTDTTNASNISSGTLNTARLPSPFTSGAISGNTSTFGTTSGTLTSGHCVDIDIHGNLVDAGSACGSGGGVSTTGSPSSGELTEFSGGTSITNGNLSGDITTSNTLATTLATVNSNTGSFGSTTAIPSFTVNGKGLITAASTNVVIAPAGTLSGSTLSSGVTASSLTSVGTIATGVWQGTKLGDAYGGTNSDSSSATGVAQVNSGTWSYSTALANGTTATTQSALDNSSKVSTTQYTDNAVQAALNGLDWKQAVGYATTANVVCTNVSSVCTYGSTGTDTVDGHTLVLNDRLLLKNQTNVPDNGIWTVTTAGAIGIAGVLTRSSDYNAVGDIQAGDSFYVINGTTNGNTAWVQTATVATLNVSNITFSQIAGPGSYVAGTGLTLTGNSFAVNASQTQITALGTIVTGVWNGTAIANANLANSSMTIGGQSISLGGTTTNQGNGSKLQLSTGTTTTNDCVKFDVNGNTVDAGSACGSGGGGDTITSPNSTITIGGTSSSTTLDVTQLTSNTITSGDWCTSNGTIINCNTTQPVTTIAGDGTYITNTASHGAVTLTTAFGSAALKATGTSGSTIPLNNGANTESSTWTFNGILNANNTITVTSNAGSASVSYILNTFTNSSAATMAITIPTAGATDGQFLEVRIYDFSNVIQTIGWTNTENSNAIAPLSSNGSTTLPLSVLFQYNGQTSKWRCASVF